MDLRPGLVPASMRTQISGYCTVRVGRSTCAVEQSRTSSMRPMALNNHRWELIFF